MKFARLPLISDPEAKDDTAPTKPSSAEHVSRAATTNASPPGSANPSSATARPRGVLKVPAKAPAAAPAAAGARAAKPAVAEEDFDYSRGRELVGLEAPEDGSSESASDTSTAGPTRPSAGDLKLPKVSSNSVWPLGVPSNLHLALPF